MSTVTFRPVEHWKSALMVLSDTGFFELLRNVFGNIKTPFNKQRILDDLLVYLSKDEVQAAVAASIDMKDRQVISAEALLGEPEPAELEKFFLGELDYGELQSLLVNLEERFVLYRFKDENKRRTALNPVLKDVLSQAVDEATLFPSVPAEGAAAAAGPANISDSRILAALLAFIAGEEGFFTGEGAIKRRIAGEGAKLFPGLDLDLASLALERLGFFRREGERFSSDPSRIRAYGRLSPMERRSYWAAAVYLCLNTAEKPAVPETFPGSSRGALRETARYIRRFLGFMDSGRSYPRPTLRRFSGLLDREDARDLWGRRFLDGFPGIAFDPLLDTLAKTGVLAEQAGFWRLVPVPAQETGTKSQDPVIAMDSPTSFIIYPEISCADALALSAFCEFKAADPAAATPATPAGMVRFELSRVSAARGFDGGMSAQDMLELLKRLSAGRLEANLDWTIEDWETRYSAVSLQAGLVLSLAKEQRYLAEAGPLARLIKRNLAPGVYLLSIGDTEDAVSALKRAGIDIFAQPQSSGGGSYAPAFHSLGETAAPLVPKSPAAGKAAGDDPGAALRSRLKTCLDKMNFGKAEKEELASRIDRRLILTEAQLADASPRHEKLEARGLDYVGKAAIAREAVTTGSLLEVSWAGPGGVRSVTALPHGIEKAQSGGVLVLRPLTDGENETPEDIRVPVGKISHIRRIKQSVFAE